MDDKNQGNDFKADDKGFNLNIDWKTAARIWRWLRTTIFTLCLGGGGYHVAQTNAELADIKERLARCEQLEQENLDRLEKLNAMPGPPENITPSGPPLIAPDTTRKVEKK